MDAAGGGPPREHENPSKAGPRSLSVIPGPGASCLMELFGALPRVPCVANLLKNMVGPNGLEPLTSTVSSAVQQLTDIPHVNKALNQFTFAGNLREFRGI